MTTRLRWTPLGAYRERTSHYRDGEAIHKVAERNGFPLDSIAPRRYFYSMQGERSEKRRRGDDEA